MRLHIIEPCPELAPLLMHFLAVEYEACESRLPARVCPALMLATRGSGAVINPDGSRTVLPRFTLNGAIMSPRHAVAEPGTSGVFVMFRPGALQQALNVAPAQVSARSVDMYEVCDRSSVDAFLRRIDTAPSLPDCVDLLQEFLLSVCGSRKRSGIGAALAAAHHKVFFPVLQLAADFGIGERQLERKVQQAFGLSLRELRRIVRFGLTLPRLLQPSVGWGDLTSIAHESGYYDQAHMHRDFADLSGLPPLQLVQKIAGDDPAYWLYRIPQPEFNRLFIPARQNLSD